MRRKQPRTPLSLVVILVAAFLSACAITPRAPVSDAPSAPQASRTHDVKQALYGELDHWRGTRFRLGGMGQKGIDCSGLTYMVYRDLFGEDLPRTAAEQARMGRPVPRDDLVPGDLVFFKTGAFRKHVGIYIGNDMFMHASVSDGVHLSSLRNRYWRHHFWKARRISSI